jgi:hypothetical protein
VHKQKNAHALKRQRCRDAEAQDAEESWSGEEHRALAAHIEKGYQQAVRGELIDGDQARREIQVMKENWLQERSPKG